MPELDFCIEGVEVDRFAITPQLLFDLHVSNATPDIRIQSMTLQCQIRIDATRRKYDPRDQENLTELFGSAERYGETLTSLLWTHISIVIPPFDKESYIELPVPCSYDFNIATTKYFYGLHSGEVPLSFLFSGAVFYSEGEAPMQIAQISWDREANYGLPIGLWHSLMEHYYPDSAWLRIKHDQFEQLYRYKRSSGFPSWEQTFETLLADQKKGVLS